VTAVVGDYELVAQLGSGGMAETHVARSLADGAIVVVKRLLPEFAGNPEFIEMFLDEGRVISSLRHPNVVALREFGFHAELPFLAMEYLHGVDLRTLARTQAFRRKQAMPTDVAVHIAASMCAGLHHAHEARTIDGKPMDVAHRDVSPQNVVITFDGAVKLIDFGIATARGRSHETRAGSLKGKIPYMAPEQVRSAAVDRRVDIYATGVVLYELLTRRRPYLGGPPAPPGQPRPVRQPMSDFELMIAIAQHDVVPVAALRPDLPAALCDVVMQAIALDPDERFRTAAAMRSELVAIAGDHGLALGASGVARLMADVIAPHRITGEIASASQLAELVSEVEIVRTHVDDDDPIPLDRSELAAPVELAARRGGVVDKVVTQDRTRLRFLRDPDPGFRWARMLEGVEGAVEIDFTGVAELTGASIAAARDAVQALGTEVSQIHLVHVPVALATQLDGRCRIVSASCRGFCPRCKVHRVAGLPYAELCERLATGGELPCPACRAPLDQIDRPAIARAPAIAPPRPAPRRRVAPIAVTCAVGVAVGAVAWCGYARRSAPPASAVAHSWREAATWMAETSGDGATELAALTDARLRALALAIADLEAALPARIRPLCEGSLEVAPSLLDRPADARLELEQVSAKLEPSAGRSHAQVRYRIAPEARARALGFYSRLEAIWGLELANAPPSRRAGVLVVAAPPGPLTPGDRIVSVAGHPLADLAGLRALRDLPAQPTLDLVIDHQERRTLGIKPTEPR